MRCSSRAEGLRLVELGGLDHLLLLEFSELASDLIDNFDLISFVLLGGVGLGGKGGGGLTFVLLNFLLELCGIVVRLRGLR